MNKLMSKIQSQSFFKMKAHGYKNQLDRVIFFKIGNILTELIIIST